MVAKMSPHVLWTDEATIAFWALKKFSTVNIQCALNCRFLHYPDTGNISTPLIREIDNFLLRCKLEDKSGLSVETMRQITALA